MPAKETGLQSSRAVTTAVHALKCWKRTVDYDSDCNAFDHFLDLLKHSMLLTYARIQTMKTLASFDTKSLQTGATDVWSQISSC